LITEEHQRSSRPGPRFLAGALVLVLVLALGLLIASSRRAEVIVYPGTQVGWVEETDILNHRIGNRLLLGPIQIRLLDSP
jgi:hypothetical protein